MGNIMSRERNNNKAEHRYDMYNQFCQYKAYITVQKTTLHSMSFLNLQIPPAKVDAFKFRWYLELKKRARFLESPSLPQLEIRRLEVDERRQKENREEGTHSLGISYTGRCRFGERKS
uniref:Uncharacterized protein n=2 Tax=Solanum tuberosum TaxID=4113 RepID=M1DKN6_SOLTU